MSSGRAYLLNSRMMADIDALDLSLGKQKSLTLGLGAGEGSVEQRQRRRVGRYRTSICIKMPIIQEVDESRCEDFEQSGSSKGAPSNPVDASAKETTAKVLSGGPFAAAVASGRSPNEGFDTSYRNEKLSRESDSILQSLRVKLNL